MIERKDRVVSDAAAKEEPLVALGTTERGIGF
jgi:hypothetical protein